ncbi:MAG: MFS transporter [Nocardioidaceae bacterium]|nr:MFS transporter [Nocardioidaceae bacterium]NUS51215.1 MFS transporter [Nocardioidaceae bacterium]
MIRAAFRTPGFGRLFTGLAASMFGDSLMLIVLSMWVKTLTGSNGAAGLTFLWMTAPALLAPAFGYVVDRVPRRTFLVVANVASALMMLPLLLVHDERDVWIIYAVAFCYGVSFVVVPAALNGLLKDMLAEELLVDANASLGVTKEALRLAGPILGATVFGFAGGGTVAMLDAATFLVAAAAIGTLTVRESEADDHEHGHWREEVGAGLGFIRRTPVLLHTTLSLGIALLVVGFTESAIYAVVEAFGKPVTFVGPILTVQGVGAIIGGLLAARLVRRVGEPLGVVCGLVLLGIGLGGTALAVEIWQLLVAVAVAGGGIPIAFVAFNTLLQRQTPARLMGRVSTSVEVITTTPQAVSIATGAILVGLLDYRVIFTIIAIGMFVAAAYPPLVLRGRIRPPATTPDEPPAGDAIPGSVLPEPLLPVPPDPPSR